MSRKTGQIVTVRHIYMKKNVNNFHQNFKKLDETLLYI